MMAPIQLSTAEKSAAIKNRVMYGMRTAGATPTIARRMRREVENVNALPQFAHFQ